MLFSRPWAVWFSLPFVPEEAVPATWGTLALLPRATSIFGVALHFRRAYRLRTLPNLHIGQRAIPRGFSREKYAKTFAEVNGTMTTRKLLVRPWSSFRP